MSKEEKPVRGMVFMDWKGRVIDVLGVGRYIETMEELVCYRYKVDGMVYFCSLSKWHEMVDENGTVRFARVGGVG